MIKRTISSLLTVFAVAGIAQAQTWDAGGVDNKWTTADNWSTDAVPGLGSTAGLTLPSSGNQTLVYDSDLYTSSSGNQPRTVTIGNTGGGVTTLEVTAEFRTQVVNSDAAKSLNLNAGGVWRQISGTTVQHQNMLIDGGTLKVEGGLFNAGSWPAGIPLLVRNGGAIEVTGGTLQLSTLSWVLGSSGSASLTVGTLGAVQGFSGIRQVGSGTAGTGTVTISSAANTNLKTNVDVQNGSFTVSPGAGRVFIVDGLAGQGTWNIGTSTGTATFNKNNALGLGGDAVASKVTIRVGANGTMNWADGDFTSNHGDQRFENQGLWNYTKSSGTAAWNVGSGNFRNNTGGTFSWQGAGGLDLRAGNNNVGTADFINQGTLETTLDGRVNLTGDLILDPLGTFRAGLGVSGTTGLRVLASGANGGAITLGGALTYSSLSGFELYKSYTILETAAVFGLMSGSFTTIDPDIEVLDDGFVSGQFVVRIVPEPTGLALVGLGIAGLAFIARRKRR